MILSEKFVSATPAFEYATYKNHIPAPLMRRTFELKEIPENATLTITGLGFYKLYVNGCDITKGLLAPYISNSDHVVYFDTYDVKKYLVKGKNVLAFILGNGFQNSIGGGVWDLDIGAFRSSPKLAFALEYDGNVIEADQSVLTCDSPITFNDIRAGVHYDANLELCGWNTAEFDDSVWKAALRAETPRGVFMLCEADPITIYKEISPVKIDKDVLLDEYHPKNQKVPPQSEVLYDATEDNSKPGFLYDFGENNAGVFRLKIKGTKGQRIVIQPCEFINKNTGRPFYGNIAFFPLGHSQRDIYICKGEGEETFIPDFTYHGFRYLWVSGITEEQATKDLLTYLVASTDLKERADFKCSDDMANKLWEASLRSDRSNFYYFPTDCPHREKNGWTGDASVSAEHMISKLSVEKSYKAWLASVRAAQRYDGNIPGIVPTSHWGFDWGNGPIWDSVAFNLPYYTYLYRGDTEIIKENAIMMMRYLDFIANKRDENGLIHYGLGDWCPVGKNCGDYDVPLAFTDTAATMDSARKAAFMFRVIGNDIQAEFAENLYYETRDAIRKNLIDFNTMTVKGACQSGQALAIALDIFEPAEKGEAYMRLLDFIDAKDGHLDTGFYGARYIFHVLSDFGDADLAFDMITRDDYPSFGFWIKEGCTTLCEVIQPEHLTEQDASINHHFWGNFTSWYLKTILGIRVNPNKDNPNEIQIKPHFIEKLSFAHGYYDAPAGRISVNWEKTGGEITLKINCAEGILAKLYLPFGYKVDGNSIANICAGENIFTVKCINN